ncbi:MAG TPA: LuxR C-terminal-related transcriptional regulator [Gemmatimonadales bacterium]|nr:LuxR C-terminal-related transcriptional regulator [Gemmatimonadales bacterium]
MTASPTSAALDSARAALARGAWAEARDLFRASLAGGETPEALDGLATAAWWLQELPAAFDARERAYRLYRERGNDRAAAGMAVWLANDYGDIRGEMAVANGWLQRAHRLLDPLEPGPEHGWLAYLDGHFALMVRHDPALALELAERTARIGQAIGTPDLEMIGVALEGVALVTAGRVAEGMRRLDEATAAAMSGDLTDLVAIGTACCYLIHACEQVRDYDRASQWCDRVTEFCRRWEIGSLFSICRTQFATVLVSRGEWERAERELVDVLGRVESNFPRMVGAVAVRLGELRRRQGRLDEAEALYAKAPAHALSLLGQAALALDRGRPAEALDAVDTYLRRVAPESRTQRVAGLELAVRAHAALGDPAAAEPRMAELREIAAFVGTEPLQAIAALATGIVLAAGGDHDAARVALEDAATTFERNRTPFEAAASRLRLARALAALGRRDAARREAEAALVAFQHLGAALEADRAARTIAELDAAAAAAGGTRTKPRTSLTRRELDVLRLVADGLSDRETAERLGLSEHTVHRHVANILTKLGLKSRTAAVAYAARAGLL